MTAFISLAVSATMFPLTGNIEMESLTPTEVTAILEVEETVISALNPSHKATIDAIHRKFGIDLPIPEKAPKVLLSPGDSVIILQADLARLNEGEVHSFETIENAVISFRRWTVKKMIKTQTITEYLTGIPTGAERYKDCKIDDISPVNESYVFMTVRLPLPGGGLHSEIVHVNTMINI